MTQKPESPLVILTLPNLPLMGDMGVRDELKGVTGVGHRLGPETTKRIRSMEYLGYGRGYLLVRG